MGRSAIAFNVTLEAPAVREGPNQELLILTRPFEVEIWECAHDRCGIPFSDRHFEWQQIELMQSSRRDPGGLRPALELPALIIVGYKMFDHRVGAAGLDAVHLLRRYLPGQVRVLPHVLPAAPCVRMANQVEPWAEQHVMRE